jgi:hypothetical protein
MTGLIAARAMTAPVDAARRAATLARRARVEGPGAGVAGRKTGTANRAPADRARVDRANEVMPPCSGRLPRPRRN